MVNNCHALRDTKTRSGVAGHFILGYFGISTRLCPSQFTIARNSSLPGLFRAIQLNMSSGEAAGFVRNTTTITTIYWDAYNVTTAKVRSGDWIA